MAFNRLKKLFTGQPEEGGIPGATVTPTGLEASVVPAATGLEATPGPAAAAPAPLTPAAPGQPVVATSADGSVTNVSIESSNLPAGFDLSEIMKVAMNAAAHPGSGSVVDLRGTPAGEQLRAQLKAAGVDIEGHGANIQFGGADAQKFQQQMFDSMKAQGYAVQAMMERAQAMMGGAAPITPPVSPGQPAAALPGGDDAVDDELTQLEKLGELKASGVLTDEEFTEQKRKILGG